MIQCVPLGAIPDSVTDQLQAIPLKAISGLNKRIGEHHVRHVCFIASIALLDGPKKVLSVVFTSFCFIALIRKHKTTCPLFLAYHVRPDTLHFCELRMSSFELLSHEPP